MADNQESVTTTPDRSEGLLEAEQRTVVPDEPSSSRIKNAEKLGKLLALSKTTDESIAQVLLEMRWAGVEPNATGTDTTAPDQQPARTDSERHKDANSQMGNPINPGMSVRAALATESVMNVRSQPGHAFTLAPVGDPARLEVGVASNEARVAPDSSLNPG